ncbi:MAG: rRNA maturation RNase YbeY [bacterium]|nr:rRNA maturation RNase YbeY [bacterium]
MFQINDEKKYILEEINDLKDFISFAIANLEIKDSFFEVSIVTEEEITNINRSYRNIDHPTDVLSFALEERDSVTTSKTFLGEIYICYKIACKQAVEFNHSLLDELCFLTLHGLLHLLGYNHLVEVEESLMFDKQKQIIKQYKKGQIMKEELQKLLEKSYSPYYHFPVACILVTKDNEKHIGVNVENASGLCMCAERNAIYGAISKGYKKKDFKEIHIMSKSNKFIKPCFVCRQVFTEFFDNDIKIICYNYDGDLINYSKEQLCPYEFNDGDLV